jgi:glycosyltransferase involved in cell wall biosynthesis
MMSKRSEVLVIVPVHNEAAAIDAVLAELRTGAADCDVVLVNDGSTDASAEIARAAGVRVLDLCFNVGIGGAMQAGFKFAVERGYEMAVQLDGDGQHLAAEIDSLVEPVRSGRCEMAIGSRFSMGSAPYDGSAARRLATKLLSTICGMIACQRFTDATSGFRAYGPRALRYLANYYPADYPEPEAIVLLSRRGLPICEVPVQMRARQGGQSSIRGTQSVYYMLKVTLALLLSVFKEGPARQNV